MRGVGVPTPIAPFVPFRFVPIQATVNDAREGRTRVFFLSFSFFFFFLLLFFTLEKSERENADKSVEGTVIKQRMPLPLIVRKVHR